MWWQQASKEDQINSAIALVDPLNFDAMKIATE